MPRAGPDSGNACAANSGASRRSISLLTNACSRWRTRSRASPSRKSPARTSTRGASIVSPAVSRPTGPPRQSISPLRVEREGVVAVAGEPPRARADLAAQHAVGRGDQRPHRLAVGGVGDEAEAAQLADIGALDAAPRPPCRPRPAVRRRPPDGARESAERRSTKRCVMRSCSASDRRSSMPRARSCHSAAASIQSLRWVM